MKTVKQIYSQYRIMPNLQMHQLRVAAVAKTICDTSSEVLDIHNIVLASVFHDMGNIIKFDFSFFPEFLEPEGLEFWQEIKSDYIKEYGSDEHYATMQIAEELNLPAPAISYIEEMGFSKLGKVASSSSLEQKICSYSDMRVGPYGILSVEDRLHEGRERYKRRKEGMPALDHFDALSAALLKIQEDIFSSSRIKPEEINDAKVAPLIETL